MDNEKSTHEVKNNDLADGLEDCKIFENILDNNLDKKTEENKNEKDDIIQKINDVLSVLEYERLEEVLKYVKRKKTQKK